MVGRRKDSTVIRQTREIAECLSVEQAEGAALEENVQAIKAWEQATLLGRSNVEQLGDWIAGTAASGPVLVLHVLWFTLWVSVNVGWIPGIRIFDPFPFTFLTMTVSLEAIFLTLFVLASQNRLTRQSDKRSHLDLQIDLLAEREMTAVLQLLQDIARHLNVNTTVTADQLRDLGKKTDVRTLTTKVEEFVETQPSEPTTATSESVQPTAAASAAARKVAPSEQP